MKFTHKIGVLLLVIFLFLYGLKLLLNLNFEGMKYIEGGLAIAAGIFLLLER